MAFPQMDPVEQTGASQTQDSSPESNSQSLDTTTSSRSNNLESTQVAQALAELEKMERFKFDGQEWTPKDLKEAILRQKDYTNKTKTLSEERKSFESERKFQDALIYDLDLIRTHPGRKDLVQEFLKVYPEKFHGKLQEVLDNLGTRQTDSQSSQQQQVPQQSQNNIDVQTLSRLQKLESIFHSQEVAKNETQINGFIDKLSVKYPDAVSEIAVGRVFEVYNQTGKMPTESDWEAAFKQSNDLINERVKAKYGDLIKKQTSANKKSQDVDAGGGTVGRAPQKFKSLSDVTKYAEADLEKRGRS